MAVLESIRYSCHFATGLGSAFAINPTRIFNTTQLPTTTAAYTSSAPASSSSGGRMQNWEILAIVLPVVGFLIIVALTVVCCFYLVRHRRRIAKQRSRAHYFHDRWNDTTMSTPWSPSMGGSATSPYPNSAMGWQMMQASSPQNMITVPAPYGH